MNNLLCSILLFCVTKLILVDADCLPYPHIPQGEFNEDCGLVTITCKKGFEMHQVMECMNGQWVYTKPTCKPITPLPENITTPLSKDITTPPSQECINNIINGKFISPQPFGGTAFFTTQDDCDEQCSQNTRCTIGVENHGCAFLEAPVIFVFIATDLNQCVSACNQRNECVSLSYIDTSGSECYLFNDVLANIPPTASTNANDIIADKICS